MGLEKYRITQQNERENLTIYNQENQPIGIVDREEAIKEGLLIEGVQLWVINPDTNQVLMQRRSQNKRSNPGKIDVSVSGHVKPGETATQAILREASEEIGIKDRQQLCHEMQKIAEDCIDLRKFGRQGNYVMTFFLVFSKEPLEAYVKDENEVEELFFVGYEELKRRVRENDSEMLIPKSEQSETLFSILDEKIKNIEKRVEEQR